MRHLEVEAGVTVEALREAGLEPVGRSLVDPQSVSDDIQLELMRMFVYAG